MARPRVELSVIVALAVLFVGAATPSETVGASKGALEGSGACPSPEARALRPYRTGTARWSPSPTKVASSPPSRMGTISTGHGAWAKIGSHTFAITIELRKFDPNGTFLGTLKATATISLNNAATEFTSDEDGYHFEFFNPFGVSTGFSGVGQATGTRISPAP